MTKILALETSCDETAVAIVEDGRRVLVNLIASQFDVHESFGGVVPELASRRHIEAITPMIQQALEETNQTWDDIDAIATTFGPGLQGALLVGLMAAKSLAWSLEKPLIGVHHLAAHIWANVLAYRDQIAFPFLCLLVSGGHTNIVRVDGPRRFTLYGETLDDAAGEAYDKVGRLLKLGYPGGPVIDRLAKEGNPKSYPLPRARLENPYDFSFSGLKTAVLRLTEKFEREGKEVPVPDVAASFQEAVIGALIDKTIKAAEDHNLTTLALAGGVAANRGLRERLKQEAEKRGWEAFVPPFDLCTDNAAMIGGLAYDLYQEGVRSSLDLRAVSRLPL
ncbi:MAG: tRNA (adenosine(37)-N6)-threonylcarbamoyltransferase complex transferase subunit TsaD [Bacteroidota bacterium]